VEQISIRWSKHELNAIAKMAAVAERVTEESAVVTTVTAKKDQIAVHAGRTSAVDLGLPLHQNSRNARNRSV
jgi:hypothetical protein